MIAGLRYRFRFVPMLVRIAFAAVVTAAVVSSRPVPAKASGALYTVTDLGSLGCCLSSQWASFAWGINSAGDIVGDSVSSSDPNTIVPFIYRNGVMTAIGTLPGSARAINDAGQAVGYAFVGGGTTVHAFLYQDGAVADLGALPNAKIPGSIAYAINNTGTIVGQSNGEAMIYADGAMSGLKRRTAYAAYGVNDAGDVVGQLANVSPLNHAFLFSGGNLTDLGTLDGDRNSVSIAAGINRSQQIVGIAYLNSNTTQRAFLYQNGGMADIGTLRGGYAGATAINNLGAIVGSSDGSVFMYRNGTMIDLNQAVDKDVNGFPMISAVTGINDNGQIIGQATIVDAQGGATHRACLLTPVMPN